jgi:Flp pilus assembly protein TadG
MYGSREGNLRRRRLRSPRAQRCSGAEMLEFTVTFLPMLVMVFYLLDVSWAIFAKSSLEYAVRAGVRYGITVTGTQATAAKSDLTSMVKAVVQRNAMGLLAGSGGLAKIKVNYLQPPASGSGSAPTDVSTQTYGNSPGNVMQVSIQGFTLAPLAPRIFTWNQLPDTKASPLSAIAADLIEPSNDLPPIGTAP